MRVFVDDRESNPRTPRHWKEARKLLPRHPATGRVMNVDEARGARRRRAAAFGVFFLVSCWAMGLIFAIVGSRDGMVGMFAGGPLVGGATYLAFWVSNFVGRERFV